MREEWEAVKQPHLSMGQAETALPHPEEYLRQAYIATEQVVDSIFSNCRTLQVGISSNDPINFDIVPLHT